jgi:GDPmannose 4,6-dehydratase
MWLALQQDEPEDFVIASGVAHSVRELCRLAFARFGLDYEPYVVTDPDLYRPAEVDHLLGDASKAQRLLGWQPAVDFASLIEMMVDADVDRLQQSNGHPTPISAQSSVGP